MAKAKRVYWDACAWIAYINCEKNVTNKSGDMENRFSMCRQILDRAAQNELEIVTSAFTLAEVCKSPDVKVRRGSALPSFFQKSFILVVPVDLSIGQKAQHLQASGLVSLKPADTVHLASAMRANVDELHTFDDRIISLDSKMENSDGHSLKICKPTQGTALGPLFEGC